MDSEPEEEPMPKLRLFSARAVGDSPETATPPHRSSVSVPFRWEEEPGKPRPCLALVTVPQNDAVSKALELPPRLLFAETKLPSPTTVLEGPYAGRRRFHSSSFRSTSGRHVSFSPERGLVVRSRGSGFKRWFGSWRWRRGSGGNNEEVSGGSLVFPSSGDNNECGNVKVTRMRRAASFSSLTIPRSHFWRTIYEGLKQAVPWKSKKLKKGI